MRKALPIIIYQNSDQQKKMVIQKIAETESPSWLANEQEGYAYQMHPDQTTVFLNYPIHDKPSKTAKMKSRGKKERDSSFDKKKNRSIAHTTTCQ